MKDLKVVLHGQTPVLMHRFATDGVDGSKLSPKEECERSAYRDADGFLAFPSENIIRGLSNAGKEVKRGGKGKATMSKVIASAVLPATPEYRILDASGNPIKDFEIHSKPVRIKATGGRVIRHRPMIRDWILPVHVRYNETTITEKDVISCFEHLGQTVGIGDWRPENKGAMGVATIEVVK